MTQTTAFPADGTTVLAFSGPNRRMGLMLRRPYWATSMTVKVNGRRVNIPSYRLRIGDVVEIKEPSRELAMVLEAISLAERDVPDYIEADHNKQTAKFVRVPTLADVPYAVQMEPSLVVEFYSR